jgi:hypothetical protein
MVTGLSLDEALAHFDNVFIFPDLNQSIAFASSVLSTYPIFNFDYRENRSKEKPIEKNLFCQNQLKEFLLNEHQLDMQLYMKVVKERLNIFGISSAVQFVPNSAEALYEHWLSCHN